MSISEYPEHWQQILKTDANMLINWLIEKSQKPENESNVVDWETIARALALSYIEKTNRCKVYEDVGDNFVEIFRTRKAQDKQRIEKRQDQIDRRAFQEVVKTNIDDYATKAAAICDLRVKPHFEKYPDKTLRGWLTPDVWTKQTKPGAPKKK